MPLIAPATPAPLPPAGITQADKDELLKYLDRVKSAQASGLSNASLAYRVAEQLPVVDGTTT